MRKLKGFTLVEILIVIVIIGILIGALVPRMQSAQGRARDVARKNDLSQIQSAILVSFQDKGVYPCQYKSGDTPNYGCESATAASDGLNVSDIQNLLLSAGMNSIPKDPLKGNIAAGLGSSSATAGEYRYVLTKSNKIDNGGFVLMANTEIEGGSNWVVCESNDGTEKTHTCTEGESNPPCSCNGGTTCTYREGFVASAGQITGGSDTQTLKLCTTLTKGESCSNDGKGECKYENETQLRYILMY